MLTKAIFWPGKGTLGFAEGNSLFSYFVVVAVVTVVLVFFWVFHFAKKSLAYYTNSINSDILSLNVHGIRDLTKRRSIFSFLKDLKANVYFLQEIYSEIRSLEK